MAWLVRSQTDFGSGFENIGSDGREARGSKSGKAGYKSL
jgi:hypothetical protein